MPAKRFIRIEMETSPTIWQTTLNSLKMTGKAVVAALKVVASPFVSIYQSFWPRSYDTNVDPEAEEFFWHPGGNPTKGVLFIHGFAASPQIFREYGKMFLKEGYIVSGARIAGHGTSISHLASTTAVDWYLSIREKFIELSKMCEGITIVAHSMGTLLAVMLASIYPVESMILLSSPIYVRPKPLYRVNFLLRPVSHFVKYWPMDKKSMEVLDKLGIYAYRMNPLRAVAGLFDCIEIAQQQLPKVTCPVLLLLGDQDEHIDLSTLDYYKEHIGSEIIETWIAPNASHFIIETTEIDEFKHRIREFVMRYSPP